MIVLSLDIGDKRIGIAKSMPIGDFVFPVETLHRKSLMPDLEHIKELAKNIGAEVIVCGLPVNFDGSESVQTGKTLYFIEELKKIINIPVVTIDERCTTMQAKDVLIEADVSRKDRKKYIDQESATFILEDYLRQQQIKKLKENK